MKKETEKLQIVNPNAAGIDVGGKSYMVVHKPIKLTMLSRGKVTMSFIGRTTEVYYS